MPDGRISSGFYQGGTCASRAPIPRGRLFQPLMRFSAALLPPHSTVVRRRRQLSGCGAPSWPQRRRTWPVVRLAGYPWRNKPKRAPGGCLRHTAILPDERTILCHRTGERRSSQSLDLPRREESLQNFTSDPGALVHPPCLKQGGVGGRCRRPAQRSRTQQRNRATARASAVIRSHGAIRTRVETVEGNMASTLRQTIASVHLRYERIPVNSLPGCVRV